MKDEIVFREYKCLESSPVILEYGAVPNGESIYGSPDKMVEGIALSLKLDGVVLGECVSVDGGKSMPSMPYRTEWYKKSITEFVNGMDVPKKIKNKYLSKLIPLVGARP